MAGPERIAEIMKRKAAREARQQKRLAQQTVTTTDKDSTPMSKATETICGVATTKFDRIISTIETAKQRKDDATMEHTSSWKPLKDLDVNTEAVKLCLKLDRQAEDKRNDFLRSFDELRNKRYAGWAAQPDMFEQSAAQASAEHEDDEGAEFGGDELPLAADDDGDETGATRGEAEDSADGPGADWSANPINAADDAEFDGFGFAFNDGKQAGVAGVGPEANPHDAGSVQADAWEKGRVAAAPLVAEVNHYNAGWAAHKAGEARDTNPCEADTKGAADWALGWDEREKKQVKGAKRGAKAVVTAEPEAQPETVAVIVDMPAGVVVPFDGGTAAAAVH